MCRADSDAPIHRSADGVTGQWLKGGGFRVRTPAGDVPARLQIAPFYDPQRLRILDR